MKKILLVFAFIFFAVTTPALASDDNGKVVRVGWFQSDMFQQGMNDSTPKSGFSYEYLLKIADYTGWQYEYAYGEWSELFDALISGEIDILAGVSITEDRKKLMHFPNYPMGNDRYYLYQHSNTRVMDPADLRTFQSKKIGCIKDNRMTTFLQEWAKENNVHFKMVYYNGFTKRDEEFKNRNIDGIVATDNNILSTSGYSAVVKVGEEPFYLAVAKKRTDLLQDLNQSLEILQEMNPYFLQNLQYSNYGVTNTNSGLTPEENHWLAHHHVLNVGYMNKYNPFSDTDKDGNVKGLITDVLEASIEQLGLKGTLFIQYKSYENYTEMLQSLQEGTNDMVFPIGGSSWDIDHDEINATSPVATVGMDLVYNGSFSEEKLKKFAVNKNNEIQRYFITENYPKAEIIYVESINECLKAVKNGEATATIINGLRVNLVRNNSDYKDLTVLQLGKTSSRFMGVRKGEAALLLLLNRGLKLIGRDFGVNASYKYMDEFYSYDIKDFIKDNFIAIGLAFIILTFLVVTILGIDARRAKKIAKRADTLNKKLEKAREDADAANNAKTTFLFNMSHDIRTPMNAIMGFTELLAKHQENPIKRNDYLKKISDASGILLSIINNVLEMARIERGTVNIEESIWSIEQFNDTLYSVFQEMMMNKGIRFTRNVDVQHNQVYCDTIKIREIFLNILSNAYKYTPEGGVVTMTVKELPCQKTGWATFETTISDTGIGISQDFLPYVFDEFARENASTGNRIEGSGLGLSIVKRLVEFMNGTISVHSTKGAGTSFVVTISHKIAKPNDIIRHTFERQAPLSFRDKRILLAEDNDLNAEITSVILNEVGFVVDRAADGSICVNMLKNADENTYDLILMDIQMPNMNGYAATNIIRNLENKKKASIPIIALTANAFEEDKQAALAAGMNGHLSKPINTQELLETLEKVL